MSIQCPLQLSLYHPTAFPVKHHEMPIYALCLAFLAFSAFSNFCPLWCPPRNCRPLPNAYEMCSFGTINIVSHSLLLETPFSLASWPSVFLLVLFPLLICFLLKLLSFACFSDIGPSNIGILQRHSTSSPQLVSLTLLASMISPSEFSQSPIQVLQGSAPGCPSALHPKMLRLLSSLPEFYFLFPSFSERCPHPSGGPVPTRKTGVTHNLSFVLTPLTNHKVLPLKHVKCFFFQSPLALPRYRPPPASHLLPRLSSKWSVQPSFLQAYSLIPYMARLIFPECRFGNIPLYLKSYISLLVESKHVSMSNWIQQEAHTPLFRSCIPLHTLTFGSWVSCYFLQKSFLTTSDWIKSPFVFLPQHTNITFF